MDMSDFAANLCKQQTCIQSIHTLIDRHFLTNFQVLSTWIISGSNLSNLCPLTVTFSTLVIKSANCASFLSSLRLSTCSNQHSILPMSRWEWTTVAFSQSEMRIVYIVLMSCLFPSQHDSSSRQINVVINVSSQSPPHKYFNGKYWSSWEDKKKWWDDTVYTFLRLCSAKSD